MDSDGEYVGSGQLPIVVYHPDTLVKNGHCHHHDTCIVFYLESSIKTW